MRRVSKRNTVKVKRKRRMKKRIERRAQALVRQAWRAFCDLFEGKVIHNRRPKPAEVKVAVVTPKPDPKDPALKKLVRKALQAAA